MLPRAGRQQAGEQDLRRPVDRVGGEIQLSDPVHHALADHAEREREQLGLRREVVPQAAHRHPGFGGDLAYRGVLESVALDHPPRRFGDRVPSLLVRLLVHGSSHLVFVARLC
ncbi:hypothetical protein AW168_09890 [Nocardia brasiliensis]|nr:hypothetical protein AW168_09890 [Nocardia brasiliensis]